MLSLLYRLTVFSYIHMPPIMCYAYTFRKFCRLAACGTVKLDLSLISAEEALDRIFDLFRGKGEEKTGMKNTPGTLASQLIAIAVDGE